MASGEVPVTCPNCQHRTSLPIAAVKRDNYYCSRCMQKIPMSNLRNQPYDPTNTHVQPARSRQGNRNHRR